MKFNQSIGAFSAFSRKITSKKVIKNLAIFSVVLSSMVLTSCTDDGGDDNEVVAPASYTFEVDSSSTVSYGGQTTRLNQAAAIASALGSASSTDASVLQKWFDEGEGFTDTSLNGTGKKLGNKTASYQSATEKARVKERFDALLSDFANNVAPNMGNDAAAGTPGMVGNRELNAKGMEIDQLFAKGLIGALCLDQIVNGYLSDAKIGDAVDNTTRNSEKSNSTAMEHHWDEGYGYLYGKFGPDNKTGDLENDGLLGKYLKKDPELQTKVFNAFKKGRAAIVANNYEVKNQQAKIIKEALSEVVIDKAIYYLEKSADAVDQSADYFHALSEGHGFILSLQFTYNSEGAPYFTHLEVEEMLNQLEAGNGLWDRTDDELTEMANKIKAKL